MTARKASYSSKNFAYDASLLPPVSRPSRGKLHESSPAPAETSSVVPFMLHDTSKAAAGGKSSCIIQDHSSVRTEKAVMQSCWIQRLNPACQTHDFEVEEPTESGHVWTHFTKDFSSCSKRLHKAHHHTRSSSWPSNEQTTKCSPSPDLKLEEPVDIKEQFLLSRAALPMFREENFRVPFQDGSESNDFFLKTGNLFSNENRSCKSVSTLEALVPCSYAARTCDEFHGGKSKDMGKLKNSAAQHSQCLSNDSASDVGNLTLFKKPCLKPKFNKASGSFLEFHSAGVLGDAPSKGKFSASELEHTQAHIRGSSPDGIIRTSLSPALTGASADADDRICTSCYLSEPLKLSKNGPAVVLGDTEVKINEAQLGVGQVCGKEMKTRRNFGFLHAVGQSKTLNQSRRAHPCLCSGSCNGGCLDKVGVHNRGSGVSMASKLIQGKQNIGLGTFATNAGPFATKEVYNLQSFNTNLRRCDPVVADHLHNLKEDLTTEMPLTRVSSGDFIWPSCRETSLDEYWVQNFEDSAPQERSTDECQRFHDSSTANIWKPDAKEKLKSFPHSNAIRLNTNDQIYNAREVPQQTQVSKRNSFIKTKQIGVGHTRGASANKSPLEGTSILRTLHEESLHGGMRRLAPKTNKEELFCEDGKTTEPSRLNEAWIQRWRSSSNLIAMSEKSFPPSLGMDKGLGSAPAGHPAITSCKGETDTHYFDHNIEEPGRRTSKLHMEGSARGYDSGSGATPRGAFPVFRNYSSLRGKYMAPSVEAMAIMGNSAGKLHTTSLQNRGSFSVWPCPRDEKFQEKRLAEPRETVEDNMHGVDMDDLKFLEHKMR